MEHISNSEDDTIKLATEMAAKLTPNAAIMLTGTLGSGKSVFARALIRALSHDPDLEVPSPTFTLVQTYDTPKATVYHFDFYRLEQLREIDELGWDDALHDGIVIAEWPERLGGALPAKRLDISFAPVKNDPNARRITIEEYN